MARFVMTAAIVLGLAGTIRAECLDGDYVVVGEPLLASPAGAFVRDVVTVADGTVAIASGCPAVRATVRRTARGTLVRAGWIACGTAAERVRLRALVNPTCRTMRARLVTRRPRAMRRFVAQKRPNCDPELGVCSACTTNAQCGDAEYCEKAVGRCDASGTCEPRPEACTRELAPVCGCDGATYPNPCVAAAHGASIAHRGRCGGDVCGGMQGNACAGNELCELPPGTCRAADQGGRCVPVPEACTTEWDPVCGCNGVTYSSDCVRRGALAQKAHDGPCVREPAVCGGIAGVPCLEGEHCELPKGECRTADLQGTCVPAPKVCPDLWAPVCGCDGVTYGNECERRMAGAQHGHAGPCDEKAPRTR